MDKEITKTQYVTFERKIIGKYTYEVLCSIAHKVNNGQANAFIQTPFGDVKILKVFPDGKVIHEYGSCYINPYSKVKVSQE